MTKENAQTYEVGRWYAWSGGECPVPIDAKVQVRLCDPREEHGPMIYWAGGWDWGYRGAGGIVSFSVIKFTEKKPREFWIVDRAHVYTSEKAAREAPAQRGNTDIIHVREVETPK